MKSLFYTNLLGCFLNILFLLVLKRLLEVIEGLPFLEVISWVLQKLKKHFVVSVLFIAILILTKMVR